MTSQVVYLDTNHLSVLGKDPTGQPAQDLTRALAQSRAKVALSLIHLIELSHPAFVSGPEVAAFLDSLPVVWASAPDDLWEAEVLRAYARYAGTEWEYRVFGSDVSSAIGGHRVGATPSQAINAFRHPGIRAEIEHATIAGIMFDRMKTDASLVTDPLKLLKGMIQARRPKTTPAGLALPTVDPADIVKCAGGLVGFPSYALMHSVASARLRDKQFQARRSDVFDLMHCAYAVYAAITALDRSYSARVRQARPDLAKQVTHRLPDVISALDGITV
jgi:hypothetical protein